MRTTLVKKLLKFIIPLLTIPIVFMLLFYHNYIIHIIEKESANLTINYIAQLNQIIEKKQIVQNNLSQYIIKEDETNQYPQIIIYR